MREYFARYLSLLATFNGESEVIKANCGNDMYLQADGGEPDMNCLQTSIVSSTAQLLPSSSQLSVSVASLSSPQPGMAAAAGLVQPGSSLTLEDRRKPGRKPLSPEEMKRKRIRNIYNSIANAVENGRPLRTIFMVLPSKDVYPDYYQVIPEPIDLTTIKDKLDRDQVN